MYLLVNPSSIIDWNDIEKTKGKNSHLKSWSTEYSDEYLGKWISRNPNIDETILESYPNIKWDYAMLSHNGNITWDFIKKYPNKGWNYNRCISNPNITLDIINSNPEFDRSIDDGPRIATNPTITWDMVQHDTIMGRNWDYNYLSMNPNITMDIIKDNPELGWNYNWFTKNPNVTWDIVKDNSDIKWNWDGLYIGGEGCIISLYMEVNPNITWDIINDNPDVNWNKENFFYLSDTLTWRNIHYNSSKLKYFSYFSDKKFEIQGSAFTIQRAYKKWRNKCRVEACTQVLLDTCLVEIFPYELIDCIASFADSI